MNFGAANKDLYLPSLKSNISDHPIFYNNTKFISNTRAFYKDLDSKLDNNEMILRSIINNCSNKVSKYDDEVQARTANMLKNMQIEDNNNYINNNSNNNNNNINTNYQGNEIYSDNKINQEDNYLNQENQHYIETNDNKSKVDKEEPQFYY